MNYSDIFLQKPKGGFTVNLSNPTVSKMWYRFKCNHGLKRIEHADEKLIEEFNRYVTKKVMYEIRHDITKFTIARWCNQPSIFKKKSIYEFTIADQKGRKSEVSSARYLKQIEEEIPELADKYFNMEWSDIT